jgi:hypothetical protein
LSDDKINAVRIGLTNTETENLSADNCPVWQVKILIMPKLLVLDLKKSFLFALSEMFPK